MLLLDLRRLEWDESLVEAAGLRREALPQVLPTDGAFGEVLVDGRRVSVRAMLGDQQAVLAGLAAQREGDVAVQLGTGGFVLRDTGAECVAVTGLLSGLARADVNKPRGYLVEGTVNSAGSALDRLKDIGLLADVNADAGGIDALCESATAPVTVVPAWAGLGAPWWSSDARASIMGWDESTTRADIVAGTVRGIAFLVADIVDAMERGGLKVERLLLSGTVSKFASMAQALADATGRELTVRDDPEATIHGLAAALATATDAVGPAVQAIGDAVIVRPRADLSAARRAFDEARAAALKHAAVVSSTTEG
jgi:glycerol kinase